MNLRPLDPQSEQPQFQPTDSTADTTSKSAACTTACTEDQESGQVPDPKTVATALLKLTPDDMMKLASMLPDGIRVVVIKLINQSSLSGDDRN